MLSNIWTIIVAIFVFALLVAIHEFGHFAAAKLFKIRVNEFSIGMGPAFFKKQGKETLYSIRAIPMGGFCRLEGEDSHSDDERSFAKAAWYKQFVVVGAGAFLNIVLGFVIFALILSANPVYNAPVIDTLIENAYLDDAGFAPGDRIVNINGHGINIADDLSLALRNIGEEPVNLTVVRDGVQISGTVNSSKQEIIYEYGENEVKITSYINGIENETKTVSAPNKEDYKEVIGQKQTSVGYILGFNMQRVSTTPLSVFTNAFYSTIYNIKLVYVSLVDLFTGVAPATQISGPIGIIDVIGQASKMDWSVLFSLVALLTVNLGVMNLLPIPALDGCKLLIIIIEAITRKKLPPEKEGVIQLIGFAFLIGILIFATYNDITRIFFS